VKKEVHNRPKEGGMAEKVKEAKAEVKKETKEKAVRKPRAKKAEGEKTATVKTPAKKAASPKASAAKAAKPAAKADPKAKGKIAAKPVKAASVADAPVKDDADYYIIRTIQKMADNCNAALSEYNDNIKKAVETATGFIEDVGKGTVEALGSFVVDGRTLMDKIPLVSTLTNKIAENEAMGKNVAENLIKKVGDPA